MQPLGITTFDKFLKNELKVKILEYYWDFNILSEADLQSIAWKLISEFISKHDPTHKIKVLNKPYLKGLRLHPDIVVFRKRTPWVVIELKEGKSLKTKTAQRERERLLKSRESFKAKKGYLIYVARYGDGKAIRGPKGPAARFFFEIPIVLQSAHAIDSIKQWEVNFKFWAKYVGESSKK